MFRPDLSNRKHTISTLLAQLPRSRFPSPLPAEPRGLPAQRWERVAFGSRRPKERRKTKDRRSNRRQVPARRTKRLIAISSHPSGQLTPLCKFIAENQKFSQACPMNTPALPHVKRPGARCGAPNIRERALVKNFSPL